MHRVRSFERRSPVYIRPEITLTRHRRRYRRPRRIRMDPDCAICAQPALARCECESKGLDTAVRQAEQRMMASVFTQIRFGPPHILPILPIKSPPFVLSRVMEERLTVFCMNRSWVRGHAQDYILSLFSALTARRKELHASHIQRITDRAYHYYQAPPHPSEIVAADAELKRGIDEDWRASVQRYPEVLEYFFGLVELSVPNEEDSCVRDPPLSALGGGKRGVRLRVDEGSGRSRNRAALERGERDREERRREGRPGVAFAPVPSYGYVQPSGL